MAQIENCDKSPSERDPECQCFRCCRRRAMLERLRLAEEDYPGQPQEREEFGKSEAPNTRHLPAMRKDARWRRYKHE